METSLMAESHYQGKRHKSEARQWLIKKNIQVDGWPNSNKNKNNDNQVPIPPKRPKDSELNINFIIS